MRNIFPRWTNTIPIKLIISLGMIVSSRCWHYLLCHSKVYPSGLSTYSTRRVHHEFHADTALTVVIAIMVRINLLTPTSGCKCVHVVSQNVKADSTPEPIRNSYFEDLIRMVNLMVRTKMVTDSYCRSVRC